MLINLQNEQTIQDYLSDDKITVVKFATSTCQPCNMLRPIFESVAKEEEFEDVTFIAADANSHPQAMQYGIMSVPTMIFFRGTEVLGQNTGFVPRDPLADFIVKLLNKEE